MCGGAQYQLLPKGINPTEIITRTVFLIEEAAYLHFHQSWLEKLITFNDVKAFLCVNITT